MASGRLSYVMQMSSEDGDPFTVYDNTDRETDRSTDKHTDK